MSGWWFSPAQLIGNSGLDFPLHFVSTKFSVSPYLPQKKKKIKEQVSSLRVAVLFSFFRWHWSTGRQEGKRANFLEVLKQG